MADQDLDKIFQLAVDKIGGSDLRAEVERSGASASLDGLPKQGLEEDKGEAAPEKGVALSNLIREMSIPQKIKLAMFGNLTARTILLRDTNKLVPFFVLENPRLTDNEVLDIAHNNQLDEGILRAVGNNLQWMKTYAVKQALVTNAKTPIDVTLKWLKFIKEKDLGRLAKSKNVPQVVSTQARKLIEKRQAKDKG